MNAKVVSIGLIALLLVLAAAAAYYVTASRPLWSEAEIETLKSLWIENLPAPPADPSNAVADDARAAEMGLKIFFDTRFSANGAVSCATCHQPDLAFTDGRATSQGIGATQRNAPTVVGTAHSPWMFWDGRKDSQWAQALGPLEDQNEHGGSRTFYAHLIDAHYRDAYEALFGPLPDLSDMERFPRQAGPVADPEARAAWEAMAPADREEIDRVFANLGKAIAAYERTLRYGPSRFDAYVEALVDGDRAGMEAALSEVEVAGLKLFIGEGNCLQCHSGPLLSNHDFHSTGTPPADPARLDPGRAQGVRQVLDDPFNCLGPYSDAEPQQCAELRFAKAEGSELVGAFKTPTLRNVERTAPYMHAGQLETLAQVMAHYNEAPEGPYRHTDLVPLNLTQEELDQLVAYLKTLNSPIVQRGAEE